MAGYILFVFTEFTAKISSSSIKYISIFQRHSQEYLKKKNVMFKSVFHIFYKQHIPLILTVSILKFTYRLKTMTLGFFKVIRDHIQSQKDVRENNSQTICLYTSVKTISSRKVQSQPSRNQREEILNRNNGI